MIDLNADVGEGCANDDALLSLVTSANIACGAHAGDDETMRRTIRAALANGVAVGAHPSFPDREHFGRIEMKRTPEQIVDDVVLQLRRFTEIAAQEGAAVHHVKAHGALYNLAARERAVADAVSRAVAEVAPGVALYGLAGGEQIASATAFGLRAVGEGFCDRRYRPDGTLVPRSQPDALIDNEREALGQALELARSGRVETICLHGDGAHAVAFARALRRAYQDRGVALRAP